ncbi:TonB-dependent receptor [Pseudoduganella sp. LjRoot289]|uniref:TonB-dependent receptor plug domain-containing protein n=1 Tax=Pseudoduganella sp. LjRoot289 TaxID=3342314 RepID=UPI003ECE1BD7
MKNPHCLHLFALAGALHASAAAADGVVRVEVAGPGSETLRRNDTAGKLVVGRDELLQYGDSTLSGVLKRLPGLSLSGSEVRMRGLGAGYTQILINGDPAPPGFGIDTLAPELIERIEIMRAASAEFSAQAVAGSINIVLRKGTSRLLRDLKLQIEHDQRWNPSATLQLADRDGGYSYSVAGTLSRTGYFSEPLVAETVTGAADAVQARRVFHERYSADFKKASLAPRLNWTLDNGDTVSWQSLIDITRSTNAGDARESTLQGGATRSPNTDWHAGVHNGALRSDISWARKMGADGKLTVKAGVNANRRGIDYRFHGADASRVPWLVRAVTSSASDNSATSSGKYLTPLWQGHNFGAGWDGSTTRRRETRLQRDTTPQGAPLYTLDQDYTADVKRLAWYAQDEWEIAPGLQAYLGLRREGLDTGTVGRNMAGVHSRSSVWSPVLQTLWKLPGRGHDQLRLALSRTYKAPLTRNLVPRRYTINNGNGPTNPDVEGNPKLRPELAWGVDAGYEKYFAKSGAASVSAYARRINDVTVQRLFQDGATWVSSLANGGTATAHGIEFDAKLPLAALYAAAPAIDLRANASRNWSRLDSVPGPHNRLAEQTPLTANLGLDYRASAAWSTGFNFSYLRAGPARLTATLSSDSSATRTLDMYALWQTGRKSQLRLSVANALHQDRSSTQYYADALGGTARGTVTPGTTGVRLQYERPL